MSAQQTASRAELARPRAPSAGRPASAVDPFAAFRIALDGPLCPKLLRDDAIVTTADGWHRTLTPSSPWATDDNEILFSNLRGPDVDGEIDRLIGSYARHGRPMRWCVYPWTWPADLGERLTARGAVRADIRAMVCPTNLPLAPVEGAEVRPVAPDGSRDFDDYIELLASGEVSTGLRLPADEVEFRRRRYRRLIAGPEPVLRLFLGRADGRPVACGALYLKPDHGWLTGDYIVPGYRARGFFQSLMAARLAVLRDLGIAVACGHGREATSVPLLLRLGWQSVFAYRIYRLDRPGAAA